MDKTGILTFKRWSIKEENAKPSLVINYEKSKKIHMSHVIESTKKMLAQKMDVRVSRGGQAIEWDTNNPESAILCNGEMHSMKELAKDIDTKILLHASMYIDTMVKVIDFILLRSQQAGINAAYLKSIISFAIAPIDIFFQDLHKEEGNQLPSSEYPAIEFPE